MEKEPKMPQKLTEEAIQKDAILVERIKAAKPLGKPMTAVEFNEWLSQL